MKLPRLAASILALAFAASATNAQFVKGNEAVLLSSSSPARVETPPVPPSKPRVCAADANCHPGPWHMVETADGLKECTEPYARPSTCRTSTYGTKKLSRLWVAKRGSTWLWCQYPDLASKCVDMNARPPANLPYDAVQ